MSRSCPSAATSALSARFQAVRDRTLVLCAPLTVEDQQVQPMPNASPTKWHLAHTTWFFETVVLSSVDAERNFLFNSYYESLGTRVERSSRGLLSRPSLVEVRAYRAELEQRVLHAIQVATVDLALLELGLQHEQQHQELILTDIKYTLGTQPSRPAYGELPRDARAGSAPEWRSFEGGLIELGAANEGFAFDNERPRHRTFVEPFEISSAPLLNRNVQAFITDGGYRDPRWWLSDGWARVKAEGWHAPLYWHDDGLYTLGGVRPIDPDEVACHLSYFEADAIARWSGARLPSEAEWELAARDTPASDGNFVDDGFLHPGRGSGFLGNVWEWTHSSYGAYPGFRALGGAVAEYNGKFMSGQQVLRGGSCFSPRDHVRATYRNFFPPESRWQMSGARLVRDGSR
ncbi:MAG: ergothioneine biosynthesis protein EgtB [Archangium sp.]|nr:ergothioneine biosynthesis protein EgtB [Archangium sp.]MDP3569843.1 ergothioneine biosynthesis protein EgtB [Archangium sp.]